jgi:pilus assembly protein TadC
VGYLPIFGRRDKGRAMSFLRGMITQVVTSMSAEERTEAIRDVMELTSERMSPEERADALRIMIEIVASGLSADERRAALAAVLGSEGS